MFKSFVEWETRLVECCERSRGRRLEPRQFATGEHLACRTRRAWTNAPPDRLARGMFAPTTAVVASAIGGPSTRLPAASVPRRRLAAATALGVTGWESSMRVPSVCTASGCSERAQFLPWNTAG